MQVILFNLEYGVFMHMSGKSLEPFSLFLLEEYHIPISDSRGNIIIDSKFFIHESQTYTLSIVTNMFSCDEQ